MITNKSIHVIPNFVHDICDYPEHLIIYDICDYLRHGHLRFVRDEF